MGVETGIRVLIVDDSSYNRRALSDFLRVEPGIEVVGAACDGEEGLQMAFQLKPDVITLDLEMPRMDGFTFLRILMSKQPTPVIVISSHAEKENVFKALELGALDFVAKPHTRISPMIKEISEEVVKKVLLARSLTPTPLHPFAPFSISEPLTETMQKRDSRIPVADLSDSPKAESIESPSCILAIAASTGGPAALSRILTVLKPEIDAGIIVVQHMPPRFTTTFADRLDKQCRLPVKEMTGSDLLKRGSVYVVPGDLCAEIHAEERGLCVVTVPPNQNDRYVPSADRLFRSLAKTVGIDAVAVVLTGMGDDGCRGAKEVSDAGGMVIAEDEATAVIPGMPRATMENGAAKIIATVDDMPFAIEEAVKQRRS